MNKILKNHKKSCCTSIACVIIAASINLYSANSPNQSIKSNQTNLDKIVAVINDDVITGTELEHNINKIRKKFNFSKEQLPPPSELRKQVLNTMVLEGLQLQMAKMNNIKATPEQINNAIDNMAKQNNVNIYDFKKLLQKDGVDFEEFKKDLITNLTIMNVQKAAVNNNINISKQEIKQAKQLLQSQNIKNKYKLSHILISVPDEPDSSKIKYAKNRAENILKELSNGKDFSKTAKIVSDGQQALKGGDMGWFNISELPSLFADITPNLKKGQIYGPIQSENGFHIIKLDDVKYNDKKYQETNYRVRHILIKKDDFTTDTVAKNKLKNLKKDIQKNNNFSDLALIYSEDHASASTGGEIGWVSNYDVVPEFADVIKSLKPNEISEPFKTRFGWHIAQLEDKKIVDNTDQWQQNKAMQILEEKKFQDALTKWQSKIKSEAHIKILI